MQTLEYKLIPEIMWGFFRRCREIEAVLRTNSLTLDDDYKTVLNFLLHKAKMSGTYNCARTVSWMYAYRNLNGPQVWESGDASVEWQNLFVATLNEEGVYGFITMDAIGFPVAL